MFFCVLIGALGAFGLVCAIWTLCGFFLMPNEGTLCYHGSDSVEFVRRYLWLREMGLIRCKLSVSDPPEEWVSWLEAQGIEVITGKNPAQTGEKRLESGTGDPPGRHQRRGLSEL